MKFLNFDKTIDKQVKEEDSKKEDASTKDESEGSDQKGEEKEESCKEEVKSKPASLPFKTDNPTDLVSGVGLPWGNGNYNLKPGHGQALVDVLRRVASDVRDLAGLKIAKGLDDGPAPASSEINWDHAFSIIEDTFKKNSLRLVNFEDRSQPGSIPYYIKNTSDGILFWVTPRPHTDKPIYESIKALKAAGIVALRRESGILVMSAMPTKDGHPADEVARFSKGTHLETKDQRDGTWHKVEIEGVTIRYKFDPTSHRMEVHCHRGDKGLINTKAEFLLTHANSRQLAKVLKYQAVRFTRMFDPATYGLHAEMDPFRLKKHVLIYCGKGKTLVIGPDDQAFLVTSKGEYPLCKEEGRVALNPNLTFVKLQDIKTLKFVHGDIWVKFGHLLQKRGLLV